MNITYRTVEKIIKKRLFKCRIIKEAHEKLIKNLPESIIWIDEIRFPPTVKLKKL